MSADAFFKKQPSRPHWEKLLEGGETSLQVSVLNGNSQFALFLFISRCFYVSPELLCWDYCPPQLSLGIVGCGVNSQGSFISAKRWETQWIRALLGHNACAPFCLCSCLGNCWSTLHSFFCYALPPPHQHHPGHFLSSLPVIWTDVHVMSTPTLVLDSTLLNPGSWLLSCDWGKG